MILKRVSPQLLLQGRSVESTSDLATLYADRVARLGFTSEALFYRTAEQHGRKLLQIAGLLTREVGHNETLLDIGCGFGSLVPVLPACRYKGIDVLAEFVCEARRRYPDREFEVRDLASMTSKFDWCVMACFLNGVPDPEETFRTAWSLARAGVCFDLIDSRRISPTFGDLHRFDTDATRAALQEYGTVSTTVDHSSTLFMVRKRGDIIDLPKS